MLCWDRISDVVDSITIIIRAFGTVVLDFNFKERKSCLTFALLSPSILL